jgi:hypothetical protein
MMPITGEKAQNREQVDFDSQFYVGHIKQK